MKKIICLSVLIFGFIGHAQNAKGTFELTPIIGFASSNYSSSKKLSNDPITTTDFGSYADYYFNNRWSIRSGFLFQTMGSEYRNGIFYTEKLKYLMVPLNANWHFGKKRNWNLNFGFSIGFINSATSNGQDIKKFVNNNQFGLSYGIGYTFKVTEKFGILIDFQGMSGLSEVAKNSEIPLYNNHSAFNVGGVFKL